MKIEIELQDVERLRNQIKDKDEKIKILEEKLNSLSEDKLKEDAVKLSYMLFDNYMSTVFKHLGFDEWDHRSVRINDNLEHWIGKEWWNSDNIKIELGANIKGKFKSAFLSIGVIPNK